MKHKIKIRFCPNCKSAEIFMVAGGKIGLWECAECHYRGSLFPEKDVIINDFLPNFLNTP